MIGVQRNGLLVPAAGEGGRGLGLGGRDDVVPLTRDVEQGALDIREGHLSTAQLFLPLTSPSRWRKSRTYLRNVSPGNGAAASTHLLTASHERSETSRSTQPHISLSELGVLAQLRPEDATLCAASEFLKRGDGLPGVERAYDFEFPNDNIVELEEDRSYGAIGEDDRCNFGEALVTDGRIKALHLTPLDADERFFPIYNASLNVREEVIDEYPASRTSWPHQRESRQ